MSAGENTGPNFRANDHVLNFCKFSRDQNNLPHTVNGSYSHIVWPVTWPQFKGAEKTKRIQLSSLRLKNIPRPDQKLYIFQATVRTFAAKYSFEDYFPSRHTTSKQRRFYVESALFQRCALWGELQKIYIKMKTEVILRKFIFII